MYSIELFISGNGFHAILFIAGELLLVHFELDIFIATAYKASL